MTSSIDKKKSQYDSERLVSWLRRYCNSDFNIEEMLQNKKIPEDFLYEAGKVGLFGMRIPTEYEGLSMSLIDTMKVIEQLASIDISLATYLVVQHTFSYPILVHGNQRFRSYYLPQIATGNIVGCFALSEPGAGSDPRKISTSIEPAGIGRWRINGTKCWITGAASSRMFLVFGRHIKDSYTGMSCFAVPGTTAGITINGPDDLMSVTGVGLRSVEFKDVEVGEENLIGQFGRGMVVAQSGLLFGRFYTAAMCSGIMKRCSQIMIRYASNRSVGAGSLLENSVTISKIKWIEAAIIANNALSKVMAKRFDEGESIAQDIAIACKVSSSELAWESADKMMQLLGGRGIDNRNFASQILRDTRFLRIGEGPTEPLLIKLGATLSSRRTELMRFLQDDMKADKALDRLIDTIHEIQELTQELTGFLDKSQVKGFKYYCIGRIGVWSLLEAGLLYQISVEADAGLLNTIEWVKHRFDETLDAIKGDISILGRNHSAFDTSLDYQQSIGKFDDTMPVTRKHMDNLLKNFVQNDNIVAYDTIRNITVIDLFEEALANYPDKEAVITPTKSLTYRAFAKEVDKLAYILRDDNNIVPGDVIAFCMGKTASFVVGILAALKTGATVLLLNVKESKERNKLMIEIAQAKMILTEEELIEFLPTMDKKFMAVDSALAVAEEKDAFESMALPQSIAYIAFTSGSTGIPKGVRVTHKAICSQLVERQNKVKIDHHDRILHTVVPNFDIAIWELFGPFAYGASIALSNDNTFTWDPRSILKLIVQFKATHIQLTPTQLGLLLDSMDSQSHCSLKCVISGGEILPEEVKEKFYQKLPEVELVHMYGPAEAVIDTTFCRPLLDTNYSSGQIGKPFSNKSLYILDENRQPVATGAPGELYIGGEVIAEGYLGEPELTKQSFLTDPFSKVPGAKMYKSGDRVRSLPSGSLEFLGRIDQQIKINGVRIEPGEIENVLKKHSTIEDLKVVVQKSKDTVKLVAYYVSNKDMDESKRLREFALQHLPKVMVPSYFVQLDRFPFTSTGKIDLKALLQMHDLDEDESHEEVVDADPVSNAIRSIWESLLECKVNDNHSDFFEVGGNSLSAIQVLTRIWEIFAVEIDAIEFYGDPTIQGLAKKIMLKQREKTGDEQPVSVPRDERIPLAGTQKNYWFLYLMNPNSPAYNCPEAMRFNGTLNIKHLEWAINELIKRHEAMRTVFINDDGSPLQVVLNKRDFSLSVVDISNTRKDKQEKVLHELLSVEAAAPFKLDEEPPFTAKLYKLDNMEHVLFWNFHHIIADGWSSALVFTNEITELYRARCEERQPVLQEISVQPIDYLYMQEKALSQEKIKRQKAFWKTELEGAPSEVDLSLGRSSLVSKCGNHGHRSYFKIPQDLYDALTEFALANKVSTYNVLMTTFVSLAHMLSGADDISIGTVMAGRKNTAIKHVMGNFANVVVVRTQLEQEHTFETLLEQVKNKVLKAMDNSDVSFEELVSTLKPNRDRNKNPLFNVFLSLFNGNGNALKLEGLTSEAIQVDPQVARFDFSIAMFEVNQSLEGYVEYKTDLFDETTIVRIIKYYQKMLSTLMHHSKRCIDDVQLVDEEEERLLCQTWNDWYAPFPRDMCLHEMFEEQVRRVPEKIAITFGNMSLTYAELNSRANKVAHYLRSRNIETGDFVGICVKSSIEMMIGVLGITKAGCAYVPLDPNLPRQRIKFIANDIHSKIILTQFELVEHVAEYAETICLDTDWDKLDKEDNTNLNIPMNSDHIIYMIFTSGSTGKPKGVRTMHYNVAALLCNTNHMQVVEEDIFLKVNNFAFDISTWEIWSPLIYGASMIGIPEKIKLDPQEFANFVDEYGITMAYLPTALFHSISIEVPEAFKEMKLLVVGGEPLDPTRSRDVFHNKPPKTFINAYGPTEVTCTSAWYDVYKLPQEASTVPIGRPISNTQFYVLNAKKRLLPVGVVGELYIGGAGVSNGYHNRPELTKKHFIDNPYKHDDKFKRLYRSGDFVRYLPNGNLQFMGRMDHQVKVRGFRIEIGEIESALREHEAVREAIVSVRGDHVDNKQLIAFLSLKKAYKVLEVNSIKNYLKERLPYYMVPSIIMILDLLPHNKNGKIDRIELNKVEIMAQEKSDKVKYPRNAEEVQLRKIWEDVIGFKEPGIQVNFFEAGGNSLKAVKLLSAINREFSKKLTLDTLFDEGTIESLAIKLRSDDESMLSSSLIPFISTDSTKGIVKPPLFMVHPLSGSAMCYSHLAHHLGYPLYGIQQYGNKEMKSLSFKSIQDIASYYIESILRVQSEGPYLLGGWSLGGIIAYEMALQLENMGYSIEKVIMLDSISPGKMQKNLDMYAILKLCLEEATEQFGVKADLDFGSIDIEDSTGIYEIVLKQLKSTGAFTPDTEIEALQELVNICTNNIRLANTYEGGKINSDILLLRPDDHSHVVNMLSNPEDLEDKYLGWQAFTHGDVTTLGIKGAHMSMLFEPNVQFVAEPIKECLKSCK